MPPSQYAASTSSATPATTSDDDRVVDVAEAVVEALLARAEGPADAREREAPDRRAEQREHGVAAERQRKTPAGIETNERTTGVIRPRKTAQSS